MYISSQYHSLMLFSPNIMIIIEEMFTYKITSTLQGIEWSYAYMTSETSYSISVTIYRHLEPSHHRLT